MTLTASELATEPDVADIIAGALQTSRAHAYELMRSALASQSEEQGKDAGRLDWCEKHLVQVNQDLNELFAVTYLDSDEWEQRTGRFTTLREAIDAAMATPKEGA